jgi:ADP-ribosyl-[dinitrogen reductase] hydrolase
LAGIADNFAAWLKSGPVDVGDTCRRGIRGYMLHGRVQSPFNQWDAGNGAVMRMLPVALFTLGNHDLLDRHVIEQAHITHNHPLSDAACVWFGRLMHLALAGAEKTRLRKELEGLFTLHGNFRYDHYRGLSTGYVVDTMQTVFHYFFRNGSFEKCLIAAVNQGGDADTTGAITGALAGAYYGMEGIPARWLKKMNKKVIAEIDCLALKLIELSPCLSLGESCADANPAE